jgi:2'-5' RNA ligase
MTEQSERSRRLFFALWPSDELRRDVEHQTRHAAQLSGGRVIPAHNFHITLAFLGSVPEARVADARECVAMTIVAPFTLILDTLNWWRKQQLLCLEPSSGAEALVELVGRLQLSLRDKGFAVELRPFRPHVTLARDVRRDHAVSSIRQLNWPVQRIELVESQISPTGSVYTILPT